MEGLTDKAPYKWKSVRVFISSTFRDFHAERDYLIKYVFPELRQWCEKYKLHLVDIDLRWGVTEQEAESGKVIELCLEQIDGCRPFFICMLGNRYGWIPNEIERNKVSEETLRIFPDLEAKWKDLSVTHLEILHAALSPLHREDPVPYSFFYFRDKKSLPGEEELKRYSMEERKEYLNTFLEEDPQKTERLQNLKGAIEERFQKDSVQRIFPYSPKFDTSLPNSEDDKLKGRFTTESLHTFGDEVKEQLRHALELQFAGRIQYLSEKREEDSLEKERGFHEIFIENRTSLFIGRKSLLQRLHQYVNSESNKVLAVYGESGSGKSSLLAKFYREYKFDRKGNEINKDVLFIAHFIGASPSSSAINSMLKRFCEELKNKFNYEDEIPFDPQTLGQTFQDFLERADSKILILIDGLNQLDETDRGQELDWLPAKLPGNVKIIASTLEGKAKDSLERITKEQLEVGELDQDERREIICEMPSVFAKTLEEKHIGILLDKGATSNPLYLKVALEELRIFGSFEKLEDKIRVLPDTVVDMFAYVLDRLEREIDAGLVKALFCFLECSRYGLMAHELEELLQDDLKEHFVILRQLRDYLISKDGLVDFFHRGLSKAVRQKYNLEHESIPWHQALARFFEEQPNFLDGDKQQKANVHKCLEQPWQEIKGERWDEISKSLCDLDFIQAKCAAKHTYDLVNDYNFALESIPDNAAKIRNSNERQARLDKYAKDLVLYSNGEIDKLEVPESIIPWSDEKIKTEIERIKTNPSIADRLKDFYNFLGNEADNLHKHAWDIPHLTIQQAWNYADSGAVAKAAENESPERYNNLLLRAAHNRPPFNPLPQALKILKGHTKSVDALSITPDGRLAISGSYDCLCILWDLNTGENLKILRGPTEPVIAVSIASDGRWAISRYEDKTSILWDLHTGGSHKILNGDSGLFNGAVITPDGKTMVSNSEDHTCIVWDQERNRPRTLLPEHAEREWVNSVDVTPDGKMALSGSHDRTCTLWNLHTGEPLKILEGHTKEVNVVAITPDGRMALSGSRDRTCILWDLEKGMLRKTLEGYTAYSPYQKDEWGCVGMTSDFNAVAITPDGKKALSGSTADVCMFWDLESGMHLTTLEEHAPGVKAMAITPDGKMTLSAGHSCILWDLEIGIPHKTFRKVGGVNDLSITPDGKIALFGNRDNTCTLWDLESGMHLRTLEGHTERVNAVSITPDGKMAISGSGNRVDNSTDTTCILWDLENSKILKTLKGHTRWVTAVDITPDGKMAFSGSYDKTCILWDLETGRLCKTFKGHTGDVRAVAITQDGKIALSASRDMTCILWDLESGEIRGRFFTTSDIFSIKSFPGGIVGGNTSGETFILHAHRELLCPGIGIITARQIWDFKLKHYQALSADCPYCGHRFSPPKLVLDTIRRIAKTTGLSPNQSPCLELPKEVWEEPGLLSACPQCGEDLKFNPFIIDKNSKDDSSTPLNPENKQRRKFWKK